MAQEHNYTIQKFDKEVLREYDIRGVVGDNINENTAYTIGRTFGYIVKSKLESNTIATGYDGRLTSPKLHKALCEGLKDSGSKVLNIGMGPTPMTYFAHYHLNTDAVIMVTGSHNPSEYNGFKMVLNKTSFFAEDIQSLQKLIDNNKIGLGKGQIINQDIDSTKINIITQIPELKELILDISPDVIINTIAYSSVDLCETNQNDADFLHVDLPKQILDFSSEIGSKMIYFSTDAVFPGELNKKYTEDDITSPVNYYGKTKLNAEKLILNHSQNNTVLRTAVIYGKHPRSRFTNWILSSLKNNQMVDPFIDQFNTPTPVSYTHLTLPTKA